MEGNPEAMCETSVEGNPEAAFEEELPERCHIDHLQSS